MNKTILLFILFSTLLKAQTSYTYLEDLQNGMYLERATSTSVKEFFDRIMSNGFMEKTNKRKWKIVANTIEYVYYGILVDRKGEAVVENFCKVDAFKVKTLFPIWENTDGVHIKAKLYYMYIHDLEQQSIRPTCDKRYRINYDNYKFDLTEKGIKAYMNVSGYCYDDKVLNIKINCLLDKNSLDVIEGSNDIDDKINPANNKSSSKFKNLLNEIKAKVIN